MEFLIRLANSGSHLYSRRAMINMPPLHLLKGEKKFKEVTVFVTKYEDQQEWMVEEVK